MRQCKHWFGRVTATFVLALAVTSPCLADDNHRPDSNRAENDRSDNDRANNCENLPGHAALRNALLTAVSQEGSGLNNQMWATIVDRDGVVCAVAFSGVNRGAQWPGSRLISAQKANTGNSFSLDKSSANNGSGQPSGLALSTANLYSAAQPGGSLFGLQFSNPVNPEAAYAGPSQLNGTNEDPLVGRKIGGVNVFGGGFGLYAPGHVIVGGIGVSGDTSCADHNIGWRLRHALGLDHMAAGGSLTAVAGVNSGTDAARPDNIIYDITPNPNGGTGVSASGYGHPVCAPASSASTLPAVMP